MNWNIMAALMNGDEPEMKVSALSLMKMSDGNERSMLKWNIQDPRFDFRLDCKVEPTIKARGLSVLKTKQYQTVMFINLFAVDP